MHLSLVILAFARLSFLLEKLVASHFLPLIPSSFPYQSHSPRLFHSCGVRAFCSFFYSSTIVSFRHSALSDASLFPYFPQSRYLHTCILLFSRLQVLLYHSFFSSSHLTLHASLLVSTRPRLPFVFHRPFLSLPCEFNFFFRCARRFSSSCISFCVPTGVPHASTSFHLPRSPPLPLSIPPSTYPDCVFFQSEPPTKAVAFSA